jgi:hypothetical protein
VEVSGLRSIGVDLKQWFRRVRFQEWILLETERTIKFHVGQTTLVDRKRAALAWPVFVDAAGGKPIVLFDYERAFEKNFTAVAAPVAFAHQEGCLLGDIGFSEVNKEKTANFPRSLSRL